MSQCFLNINQNLHKNGPQKNDNLFTFCQKTFFDQTLVFLNLSFLKDRNIDVDQKTQLKTKKITKIRKGFERQRKTGNPQKQKGLMKICNLIV